MSHLINQAAYLYVYSKRIYKIDHEIKDMRKDVEKYTERYHRATSISERQKYQKKLERHVNKYREMVQERTKLLHKLHEHNAGFARMLQQETHHKP